MLDQAFNSLKTFDLGSERSVLSPIDDAAVAVNADPASREKLEKRLTAALETDLSRAAKDFIFRKLMIVGTAVSVPVLARMLREKDHSHMARYALERIPVPAAAKALRDALADLDGEMKVGVIGSLGVRQDEASVVPLAAMLVDGDSQVALAAARALGAIRTSEAGKALAKWLGSSGSVGNEICFAATDSTLACAEHLLAKGKKSEALGLFKSLTSGKRPKHVRLAATRGMLACAGK